ncbi:MAG: hypothetical protein ABJD11_16940, partial [Gemmatimonadota bacterium]
TMRTVTLAKQYHQQSNLKVRLEFAAGTLHLAPGEPTSLYDMRLSYDEERFVPISRFDATRNEVQLGVVRTGEGGLRVSSAEHLAQEATVTLTPRADLSLDLQLGAVDGTIELGGLRLRQVHIGAAASRTEVRFSTANAAPCDVLALSAGAAEFSVSRLGNSRCRRVSFEGGVGDVTLDLTGDWNADADLDLRVAVGELTLRLPREVGVEIVLDRFLSTFQPSGFTQTGRTYRSSGFAAAQRKLHINLTSAVGGVKVEWDR